MKKIIPIFLSVLFCALSFSAFAGTNFKQQLESLQADTLIFNEKGNNKSNKTHKMLLKAHVCVIEKSLQKKIHRSETALIKQQQEFANELVNSQKYWDSEDIEYHRQRAEKWIASKEKKISELKDLLLIVEKLKERLGE